MAPSITSCSNTSSPPIPSGWPSLQTESHVVWVHSTRTRTHRGTSLHSQHRREEQRGAPSWNDAAATVSLNLCSLDFAVCGESRTGQGLLTGKPIVGSRKSPQPAPSNWVSLIWFGEKHSWWVRSSGVGVRHRPECSDSLQPPLFYEMDENADCLMGCLGSRSHWSQQGMQRMLCPNGGRMVSLTQHHKNVTGPVPVTSCWAHYKGSHWNSRLFPLPLDYRKPYIPTANHVQTSLSYRDIICRFDQDRKGAMSQRTSEISAHHLYPVVIQISCQQPYS